MNSARAIHLFDSLAQQHRLAVIRLLAPRPECGLSAGAIAEALGVPASSLSFHLAQLRQAGLIRQERRSRSLIYSIEPATLESLIGYLLEKCCSLPADGHMAPLTDPRRRAQPDGMSSLTL